MLEFKELNQCFLTRVEGVVVNVERAEVVERLRPIHDQKLIDYNFDLLKMHYAEQVHGAEIAEVCGEGQLHAGVDGLITAEEGVGLGIYVADCAAVYLYDPVKQVCALLHSGKKGSELDITGKALRMMKKRWGCLGKDIHVWVSPCIRPPAYEVDFSKWIEASARAEGCVHFTDEQVCTARDLNQFYSYRAELGKTGRMLAALSFRGKGI
jgi:polyphenol oxidase